MDPSSMELYQGQGNCALPWDPIWHEAFSGCDVRLVLQQIQTKLLIQQFKGLPFTRTPIDILWILQDSHIYHVVGSLARPSSGNQSRFSGLSHGPNMVVREGFLWSLGMCVLCLRRSGAQALLMLFPKGVILQLSGQCYNKIFHPRKCKVPSTQVIALCN